MSSSPSPSFLACLSQCDNDELYHHTGYIIPELALLGYTDVAGRDVNNQANQAELASYDKLLTD